MRVSIVKGVVSPYMYMYVCSLTPSKCKAKNVCVRVMCVYLCVGFVIIHTPLYRVSTKERNTLQRK